MPSATTTDVRAALQAAAAHLASLDGDRARDENGVGYSQADTSFGHRLAETDPSGWSRDATQAAWVMLSRYRGQLAKVDLDVSGLDAPYPDLADGDRDVKAVDWDGGSFVIRFGYDPLLVEAVKRLPGRAWNKDARVWTAGTGARTVIAGWADRHGFRLTDAAQAVVDAAPDDEELPPTGTVDKDGNLLTIRFEYDPAAVMAVKRVSGRQWDAERRLWTAPVEMVRDVRKLADEYGWQTTAAVDQLEDVDPRIRPTVSVTGGMFFLAFPYDRDIIGRAKELPGSEFARIGGQTGWVVPLTSGLEVFEFILATEAHIDGTAEEFLSDARAALDRIVESGAADADYEVANLGGTLRPFQRAGVAYMSRVRRGFIADEMGLGKTVQALALLEDTDAYPAVVVCPASLKLNWQREVEKWLPHRTVGIVTGEKRAAPQMVVPDVTIVGDSVVHAWQPHLRPKGVVVDESHRAKNPKARRTLAVVDLCYQARMDHGDDDVTVCLLSGTPVKNREVELVPQLHAVGRLDEFGGRKGVIKAAQDGTLNRRLRATCYVRRLKADVLTELPDKVWAPVEVEGDPKVMVEYRKAEADILAYLAAEAETAAREAGADDDAAARAAWERRMRASGAEHLAALGKLRQLAAKAKMAVVGEQVERFEQEGQKLVVFGVHRAVVGEVGAKYADGATVWGGQTTDERQAHVDRFQNDDDLHVIACSIEAGGVGLTLTAASDVLFVEQDWTPAGMDQAVDRCHRIGQQDSVTGWVLQIPDTIDVDMADLIAQKRQHVDAVTDGDERDKLAGGSIVGDLLVRMTERALNR